MTKRQNFGCDYSRALIHLNGLMEMVNMRGGVHTLPGVVRRHVLWYVRHPENTIGVLISSRRISRLQPIGKLSLAFP
jgi:hypothetical protein